MSVRLRISLILITSSTALLFALYSLASFTEASNFLKSENNEEPNVTLVTLDESNYTPATSSYSEYIEIVDSCGPYFDGECVNIRSGPSEEHGVVRTIRNGVILKVSGKIWNDGREWYKIVFDEWIRYPERIKGDWYVAAQYVRPFLDGGSHVLTTENGNSESKKYILIDRSDQTLYAYDGDALFMKQIISTGIELTPTPRGTFTIFKKTPSRYMQGPLPGISSKYYDLPGVPWNLYFTQQGAVIHGAYWHDKFGQKWSSGCVNVDTKKAEKLYKWADIGTKVIVRD